MGILFSIRECLLNIRRSLFMFSVSVLTITVSLVILGLFGIATLNIILTIRSVREKVDMEVYLREGMDDVAMYRLRSQVEPLPGIKTFRYVSKEEALREGRVEEEYLRILDENPLPASFRITFKEGYRTTAALKRFAGKVRPLRGVEDVVYGKEWITVLDRITQTFIILDLLLGAVFCLACGFVVANTIRLSYVKRADAIEIMQLAGASRGMVKRPFILEGILQGTCGGALAVAALFWGLTLLNPHLHIAISVPGRQVFAGLPVLGMVLGYLGSTLAVRSYME